MTHDTGPAPNTRSPVAGFTLGSLCTGTGGFDLAVERTSGAAMVWCAEVMPAAARVIEARFPGVPNFGDLNALDPQALPRVDVISAGFPCQPVSVAGKRLGADDPRYIWPRIAAITAHLRPKALVLENVPGLLSKGFDVVVQDLSEMGFDAEWGTVSAESAGAPHLRDRLFVFSWPADDHGAGHSPGRTSGTPPPRPATRRRFGVLPGPGGGLDPSWTDHAGSYSRRLREWERATRPAPWPVAGDGDGTASLAPEFAEWMMGLPHGWVTDPALGLSPTQQLRLLGNAVVPQAAELALTELARRACAAVGIAEAA
ncbi:MAG: DNA cytosine methyltransferase [Mycobacterium sp.]|nr:DNA cytosine methyltransferase [Mycobacterium sp.]